MWHVLFDILLTFYKKFSYWHNLEKQEQQVFPSCFPIILLLLALLFFPDCKIWHGRNSSKKIRHVSFALPWRRISIPRRILKFLFFTFLCQRDTKDSKLERFSTSFFYLVLISSLPFFMMICALSTNDMTSVIHFLSFRNALDPEPVPCHKTVLVT